MSDKHKFLIVGAGLSGLSVAVQLIRKGKAVTIVDNQSNICSRIAAGMINPLVFRRMTKSWRLDEFMPYLIEFYRDLEKEVGSAFFHPVKIRRMFSNDHERDLWLKKEEYEEFKPYMHPVTKEDLSYDKALNPFGSGRVKSSFYVDTPVFLDVVLSWVEESGTVIREQFDYSSLIDTTYGGEHYDAVVFCEGHLAKDNPWFKDVNLDQTKGELLTIKSMSMPEDESVNRKCFVLPIGNHLFKVGSTHDWNNPTTHITKEGREEILKNLSYITNEKVEVVEQFAGVRPTVVDRRPLIGAHPDKKDYYIFNGLGTKGYMLAPLLSLEFIEYLLDEKPLDKEVDVKRCL